MQILHERFLLDALFNRDTLLPTLDWKLRENIALENAALSSLSL